MTEYATLKIGGMEATLTEAGWVSATPKLAAMLNKTQMLTEPGYHPNVYAAHARYIGKLLGGKVEVKPIEVTEVKAEAGVVY